MAALVAHRVCFSFSDAAPLFDGVDLHLGPGWTGVVGPNGAGKTTLLRLLAGELAPDAGHLRAEPDGARIEHCPQRVDAHGDAIALLGADETGAGRRLRAELALDPAELARWPTLSPGERKRWQVGAALFGEPDVLLLDEPTNHLDACARARLVAALRAHRGVGLVVAHDRELLDELTTRTLRVAPGDVRVWRGGYSAAKREWDAERRGEGDARARLRDEERAVRARLHDAHRAHAAADAGRSMRHAMKGPRDHDARNGLAKGRAAAAEKRAGRDVAIVRERLHRVVEERSALTFEKELGGAIFAGYERAPAARILALDSPDLRAGARAVLRDVRVSVARDARVRVLGDNGAGKTTLLRALVAGARDPRKILYVPQETTTAEDVALVREVRALPPDARGRVLSIVGALGVRPGALLASEEPSPGEARKLRIAQGLGCHAWALVLDEPTNHLDLPSIERLEAALAGFPGALVLVTHDTAFARAVTREVWRVEGGRVTID